MEKMVCIDGLPSLMTSAELISLCSPYGSVESAEIMTDAAGQSLEYGIVRMASAEEAEAVVGGLDQLDRFGTILYAARLSVEFAIAS